MLKFYLNDLRFVDLRPLTKDFGLTWLRLIKSIRCASTILKPVLIQYIVDECKNFDVYEDLMMDRHTPSVPFYICDIPVGVFLVHLAAVKEVCKILDIDYPEKSINIRLECIKRRDVHLRNIPPKVARGQIKNVFIGIQNIKSLIDTMSLHLEIEEDEETIKRLTVVKRILEAEHVIQFSKWKAFKSLK